MITETVCVLTHLLKVFGVRFVKPILINSKVNKTSWSPTSNYPKHCRLDLLDLPSDALSCKRTTNIVDGMDLLLSETKSFHFEFTKGIPKDEPDL